MLLKNLIAKDAYFVANEIGIEWNKISDATFSPIEEAILNRFSKHNKYNPKSDVYIMMRTIGEQLLKNFGTIYRKMEKVVGNDYNNGS